MYKVLFSCSARRCPLDRAVQLVPHLTNEFGAYPPNATLQDVANDRVSMYGNHVDAFIKEKKNEPKKDVSGSREVGQDNSQGKRFIDSPFKAEAEKEELGF